MRKLISLLSVVAIIGAFAPGCASHKSTVPDVVSYPYPPRPFMTIPRLTSDTYVGYSDGYIWPLVPGNHFVIFETP
jgi:hypothetical protein